MRLELFSIWQTPQPPVDRRITNQMGLKAASFRPGPASGLLGSSCLLFRPALFHRFGQPLPACGCESSTSLWHRSLTRQPLRPPFCPASFHRQRQAASPFRSNAASPLTRGFSSRAFATHACAFEQGSDGPMHLVSFERQLRDDFIQVHYGSPWLSDSNSILSPRRNFNSLSLFLSAANSQHGKSKRQLDSSSRQRWTDAFHLETDRSGR